MEGDTKNSTTENEKDELVERMNVLVVDDDSTCLSITAGLLKRNNYQVFTAKNGKDALCTLETNVDDVDLVVTDVHMPIMNGIVLQQNISKRFAGLPVVLMSANKKMSLVLEGLDNGAQYFLLKPVQSEDLKNLWQFVAMPKKNKSKLLGQSSAGNNSTDVPISLHEYVITSSSLIDGKGKKECKKEGSKRKYRRRTKVGEQKKDKLIWTEDLHTKFLDAINQRGINEASSKDILDIMNEPGLNRDNIASHLQKYRNSLKKGTFESSRTKTVEPSLAIQSSYASKQIINDINKLPKRKEEFDKYLLQMILSKRPEYAETSAQPIQSFGEQHLGLKIRYPSIGSTSSNIENQKSELVEEGMFPREEPNKGYGVMDIDQNLAQRGFSSFGFKRDEKYLGIPTNHTNEDQENYVELPSLPGNFGTDDLTSTLFSQVNVHPTREQGDHHNVTLEEGSSQLYNFSPYPLEQGDHSVVTAEEGLTQVHNFQMNLLEQRDDVGVTTEEGSFQVHNYPIYQLERGDHSGITREEGLPQIYNFLMYPLEQEDHVGVATHEGSFQVHNYPIYPLEQGDLNGVTAAEALSQVHNLSMHPLERDHNVVIAAEGLSKVENISMYPLKQGEKVGVTPQEELSQTQNYLINPLQHGDHGDVTAREGFSQLRNCSIYPLEKGDHGSVTMEEGSSQIQNFPVYPFERRDHGGGSGENELSQIHSFSMYSLEDDGDNNIWGSILSSSPFNGCH